MRMSTIILTHSYDTMCRVTMLPLYTCPYLRFPTCCIPTMFHKTPGRRIFFLPNDNFPDTFSAVDTTYSCGAVVCTRSLCNISTFHLNHVANYNMQRKRRSDSFIGNCKYITHRASSRHIVHTLVRTCLSNFINLFVDYVIFQLYLICVLLSKCVGTN